MLALLSVLAFGPAAIPAVATQRLPEPSPSLALRRAPVSAGPSAAGTLPAAPKPREAPLRPRPGNHPPRVRSADFPSDPITAVVDLRLAVEAFDPDGDSIRLRTTWWVDGVPLDSEAPVLTRDRFGRGSRIRASVVAVDGSHASEPCWTRELVVGNAPPAFTTFPNGFDATGSFVYPIGVVDADGDRDLEFHLLEGPPGMRIEAHEGTLTWRPRPHQVGRHPVRVEVRDGQGGSESQAFSLEVRHPPRAEADLADR